MGSECLWWLVLLRNGPNIALSPYYTLLLPLRIEPYTDGRSWARRPGFDRHLGLRPGEELTDEDEE